MKENRTMSSVRYEKIANDTWERPAVRAGWGNISDGQAAASG